MNAIYARQSVDRADSISIESQIEFCRYELKGEPYKVYADRGYSGKNTDRPAFGEMMCDMETEPSAGSLCTSWIASAAPFSIFPG